MLTAVAAFYVSILIIHDVPNVFLKHTAKIYLWEGLCNSFNWTEKKSHFLRVAGFRLI